MAFNSNSTIHVACCFDRNYELPFIVLAKSIQRASSRHVVLHALHEGPLDLAPRELRDAPGLTVNFIDVTDRYGRFNTHGPQTTVTYARLSLPDILEGVERVLYLDTDMLVMRDIAPLYFSDLGDCALGAVIDYGLLIRLLRDEPLPVQGATTLICDYLRDTIRLSNPHRYFNAGALLVDLVKFRSLGIAQRAREALSNELSRAIFNDQDALNFAVAGAFVELDPRWNAIQDILFKEFHQRLPAQIEAVVDLYKEPWIMHYAGVKPWRSNILPGPWERQFWQAAQEAHVEWPLLWAFWRAIPYLRPYQIDSYLWEARNRGPKIGTATVMMWAMKHFMRR